MFSRLLILFVVIPALELYLLIKIGQVIGALETFGLILVTGIVGSAMAKTEGLAVWARFNRRLASGNVPGKELVDGLIILVSGAFLITPGVLTDFVGLLGLFPLTRRPVRELILRRIKERGTTAVKGAFFSFGSGTGMPETNASDGPGQQRQSAREAENPARSGTTISGQAKSRPAHEAEEDDRNDG